MYWVMLLLMMVGPANKHNANDNTSGVVTVLETMRSDLPCYEFTWTCAGELGDRIGQGILMDDGNYHYVMTALWDAEKTEQMQLSWSEVFSSFDVA